MKIYAGFIIRVPDDPCSTMRKPTLSNTLYFFLIILYLAPSTRHLPALAGKCEGWSFHSTNFVVPVVKDLQTVLDK